MLACQLNGVIHPAAGSPDSDFIPLHMSLRIEILKSYVDIVRPYFGNDSPMLLRCQFVIGSAAALAEAAIVQGENVYTRCGRTLRERVPRLALPVALMQKQNSGAGFSRIEIARLKNGAIFGRQGYSSRRRHLLCRAAQPQQKQKKSEHNGSLS